MNFGNFHEFPTEKVRGPASLLPHVPLLTQTCCRGKYVPFGGLLRLSLTRGPTTNSCRQYAFFRQVLLIINQVVVCCMSVSAAR